MIKCAVRYLCTSTLFFTSVSQNAQNLDENEKYLDNYTLHERDVLVMRNTA